VRNDISGEQVNLGGGVAAFAGAAVAGADAVSAAMSDGNRLDLNAGDATAAIDDEVVRSAFAVRLGDTQAELDHLLCERKFGDLALELAVEVVCHGFDEKYFRKKEAAV
jgi:hypothetical protein